jgi:hypothetical protein
LSASRSKIDNNISGLDKEKDTYVDSNQFAFISGDVFKDFRHDYRLACQYANMNRQKLALYVYNIICGGDTFRSDYIKQYNTQMSGLYESEGTTVLANASVLTEDTTSIAVPLGVGDGVLIVGVVGTEKALYAVPCKLAHHPDRQNNPDNFGKSEGRASVIISNNNAKTLEMLDKNYDDITKGDDFCVQEGQQTLVKPVYIYKNP